MTSDPSTVDYQRFQFAGGIQVDVARFILAAGVTESMLIDASNRLQSEFAQLPGFLGRLLVEDHHNTYLDILYWSQPNDGFPSMAQRAETSQACAAFLACLAEPPDQHPPVDNLIRGLVTTSSAAGLKG